MPTVTYTQPNGTQQTLQVEEGTTLMRAAVSNGIDGIIGECGGQAMCATCHVYVRPEYAEALPEISDDEDEMLDCATAERMDSSRLGCQIKIDAELTGIVVDIPAGQLKKRGNDMSVVIIGGGQAGLQVADTLRTEGYGGEIHVIAEESGLPYQRPPLSKDYLAPGQEPAPLPLRGASFFVDKNVTLHEGAQALAIDRAERKVKLTEGSLDYDHLVFATGARNRMLNCPGASLSGIHGLKTLTDAEALHTALPTARNIVIIGAGFIGLEFAAAALAHGCDVTVLEFAPRPMGRALTPVMGEWFAAAHRSQGVDLRLGEGIDRFEPGADGRVGAAVSTTGASYPADLVLVGIGVQPNDTLASDAGLETSNGIVVDETLRTADPAVLAIGDCASFPSAHAQVRLRLESVQNATDQARHAARTVLGANHPYTELPWFWSTQGPYRLQMAGLARPDDDTLVLGDQAAAKFSVLCFRDGVLTAVESVNAPADHMAARKLLAAGTGITRDQAETEGFTLKAVASTQLVPVVA